MRSLAPFSGVPMFVKALIAGSTHGKMSRLERLDARGDPRRHPEPEVQADRPVDGGGQQRVGGHQEIEALAELRDEGSVDGAHVDEGARAEAVRNEE
jgi:hypothetical protein